ASLAGADALRFSTWSRASQLASSQIWPLSPVVALVTQDRDQGVAWEYQIALANETGADPWFVIPAGATNAYVVGVSDLVHRFLDPRLHAYVEYADGMLTPGSPTNSYARLAALNAGLGGDASTSPTSWYEIRSRQIAALAGRVFGPDAPRVSELMADAQGLRIDSSGGEPWRQTAPTVWASDSPARPRVGPAVGRFEVGSDMAP